MNTVDYLIMYNIGAQFTNDIHAQHNFFAL